MRNRNMYYATGLPGWVRFGYSPGWVGQNPNGLSPCAQFFMNGQWTMPQTQVAGNNQLAILKNQAAILQQQLDMLNAQIDELEND